jgi:hypothetical protein
MAKIAFESDLIHATCNGGGETNANGENALKSEAKGNYMRSRVDERTFNFTTERFRNFSPHGDEFRVD